MNLDPIGTAFFLPSMISLLLALQWGGSTYSWSSWRIILLLVIFAVMMVGFIAVQVWLKDTTATLPARIITQRTVAFGALFQLCIGSAMMVVVYYMPLWFQAIKGASAVKSGIMVLPIILSLVVGSILCGGMVQKFGYYTPFMIGGSIVMSIGAGLLTTLEVDSGHGKWIGYQVALGLGIGMGMQQANLAVQCVLPKRDVPTGSAALFFFQSLGGAIFVSVGQNVFLDKLVKGLAKFKGFNSGAIVGGGATSLRQHISPENLPEVLTAYNDALTTGPLLVAMAVASISIIGALGIEWKSVKKSKPTTKKTDIESVGEVAHASIGEVPDADTQTAAKERKPAARSESAGA